MNTNIVEKLDNLIVKAHVENERSWTLARVENVKADRSLILGWPFVLLFMIAVSVWNPDDTIVAVLFGSAFVVYAIPPIFYWYRAGKIVKAAPMP